MRAWSSPKSMLAAALASIGASLCCVAPLILLSLGIGGAWISYLTRMEPYRPLFVALTLGFLGWAFYRLYLQRPACTPGTPCADALVVRRQRLLFWLVGPLLLGLLAVPWLAPLFN